MSHAHTKSEYTYLYTSPDAPQESGRTWKSKPQPGRISKVIYTIAGIKTTVYGLNELPKDIKEVTVLWLLHPRLTTETYMAPFASYLINSWNNHNSTSNKPTQKGLIAVSFDQRNHGTREQHSLANEAWRDGNDTHAQDMFSTYHGTALDTSLLLDFLPAYIFPTADRHISQHVVMGVSLGGHAAWHCLLHDPRITAGIVVIGCPDYTRLMSDRARLSKRETFTESSPPGSAFVGSKDFPVGLVDAVARYDPAGLLWGNVLGENRRRGQEHLYEGVTDEEKAKLLPVVTRCFGGKRILNLAGGADKLVPYAMCKPFLDWLKAAIAPGGWFDGGNLHLEDIVVPGAGHEVPPEMVLEMERFMIETMENEKEITAGKKGRRDSRI